MKIITENNRTYIQKGFRVWELNSQKGFWIAYDGTNKNIVGKFLKQIIDEIRNI